MRELLVMLGLISLGYFAQSSIGMALNKSCEYYEEIATVTRSKSRDRSKVALSISPISFTSLQNSVAEQEARHAHEAIRDQIALQPVTDLNEVKITQTGPKATPTIR